jgi:hypothetical protein
LPLSNVYVPSGLQPWVMLQSPSVPPGTQNPRTVSQVVPSAVQFVFEVQLTNCAGIPVIVIGVVVSPMLSLQAPVVGSVCASFLATTTIPSRPIMSWREFVVHWALFS